jgi:hypothetical protein
MIEIKKDGIENYELCNLCFNAVEIKLKMISTESHATTTKLCTECTYELYKELHEHQMDKIITEVNKGK